MKTRLLQSIGGNGKVFYLCRDADIPCTMFGGMTIVVGGDPKLVAGVSYNLDEGTFNVVFDPLNVQDGELFDECLGEHLARGWKVVEER